MVQYRYDGSVETKEVILSTLWQIIRGDRMFIGLMGVDNDGKTMYTPSGNKIFFTLPWGLAWHVQEIQHWIAKKTWR